MTYIGSLALPFITNQGNSKQRPVEERDYVGYAPMVEEFDPQLEAGTFSVILDGDADHPDDLSLTEQLDGVRGLVERPPVVNTYSFLNDEGFLSIENVSTTQPADRDVAEAQFSLRFMEDADYRPIVYYDPQSRTDDFGIGTEDFRALPGTVTDVEYDADDGTYTSLSPDYSLQTAEDETVDIYDSSEDHVLYEQPGTDYALPQRTAEVTAEDGDDDRVFTKYSDLRGGSITNGLVELTFDETNDQISVVAISNGSGSEDAAGTLSVPLADTRLVELTPQRGVVKSDDRLYILERGHPFFSIRTDYTSQITFDIDNGSDAQIEPDESTRHGTHSDASYDYILTRNIDDGNFGVTNPIPYDDVPDGSYLSWGFDFQSLAWDQIARWSLTNPNRRRTLVARSSLP